jgi:hypothetical protein
MHNIKYVEPASVKRGDSNGKNDFQGINLMLRSNSWELSEVAGHE